MSPLVPSIAVIWLTAFGVLLRPAAARPSAGRSEIQAHNSRLLSQLADADSAGRGRRLLDIDWAALRFDSDADALKVWRQIAPTGADWEKKLEEVPGDLRIAHALGISMIRAGNFACAPVRVKTCEGTALGMPPPAPSARLGDPCLRRRLAVWSFERLEAEDIPTIRDALRAIVKLPPPESELVALALRALPESDSAGRYELLELAWKAGHRELVNGMLGGLPDRVLIDAVLRLHIDGALDMLSVEAHRAVYTKAVRDENLNTAARVFAINQLAESASKLTPDLRALLVGGTKHRDCAIAAAAARALENFGDLSFLPLRPVTGRTDVMMRSLCVLASYQSFQNPEDPTLLDMYVASRGLEIVRIAHLPYNAVDADRDGNPRVERTIELVPRHFAKLPDVGELRRAFERCTGATCSSRDRTFKFVFRPQAGALALWRIEVVDKACDS